MPLIVLGIFGRFLSSTHPTVEPAKSGCNNKEHDIGIYLDIHKKPPDIMLIYDSRCDYNGLECVIFI